VVAAILHLTNIEFDEREDATGGARIRNENELTESMSIFGVNIFISIANKHTAYVDIYLI
jgi:myosin heavy subunit